MLRKLRTAWYWFKSKFWWRHHLWGLTDEEVNQIIRKIMEGE